MWSLLGGIRKNFSKKQRVIKYNLIDVSKIVISEEPMPPPDGRNMASKENRFDLHDQNEVLGKEVAKTDVGNVEKECQCFHSFELQDWDVAIEEDLMDIKPDQKIWIDESVDVVNETLNKEMSIVEGSKTSREFEIEKQSTMDLAKNFGNKAVDMNFPCTKYNDNEITWEMKKEKDDIIKAETDCQKYALQDLTIVFNEQSMDKKPEKEIIENYKSDILYQDSHMANEVSKVLDYMEVEILERQSKKYEDNSISGNISDIGSNDFNEIMSEMEEPFEEFICSDLGEQEKKNVSNPNELCTIGATKVCSIENGIAINSKIFVKDCSDKLIGNVDDKYHGGFRYRSFLHKFRKYLSVRKRKMFKKRNEKNFLMLSKRLKSFQNNSIDTENKVDIEELQYNYTEDENLKNYNSNKDIRMIHGKGSTEKSIKNVAKTIAATNGTKNVDTLRRIDIKSMTNKVIDDSGDICQEIPQLQQTRKSLSKDNALGNDFLENQIVLQNGKKDRQKRVNGENFSKANNCCKVIAENDTDGKHAKNGKKLKLKWFRWPLNK